MSGHGQSRNMSSQQGNKKCCQALLQGAAETPEGVMEGKSWLVQDGYLAIFRKKIHNRLGAVSWTESDDPADPG